MQNHTKNGLNKATLWQNRYVNRCTVSDALPIHDIEDAIQKAGNYAVLIAIIR